jgi:uncharacterized protein YdhG (YjbR/CyaY superfamily)
MSPDETKPRTIDEYIARFPPDVRDILQKIRATIRDTAPDAEETISYGIPIFKLQGQYLIYFAGYKRHCSIYPIPAGDAKFREAISSYKSGKGTLKFPLDTPVPLKLVIKIVKLRIKENSARSKGK